ncbi:MAG: type IV pilus assembly protein PilV [Candidatus Azotimanducaceae bacterium]|jgi:type IV pilus assembly protein PilV
MILIPTDAQTVRRPEVIREQGFTLIEVLVAMLIVAVGVLGVAGMQVVSLQQNRNALLRDQALQSGNDILDRMRANPLTDYAPVLIDDDPVSEFNCMDVSCDRNEMAEFDIAQWKCGLDPIDDDDSVYAACTDFGILQAALPEGKGSIERVGSVHVVTVEWVNDREGNVSQIILRTRTEAP